MIFSDDSLEVHDTLSAYVKETVTKPKGGSMHAKLAFRIPHFTHHFAADFRTVHSAFYFPHSAIPHFTGNGKDARLIFAKLLHWLVIVYLTHHNP